MSKAEIQFIVSCVLGMAFFWLSGKATAYLPVINNQMLAQIVGIIVSAGVYGLGMAGLAAVTLGAKRSLKGILVAAVVAMVLAELTAQVLLRALVPLVQGNNGLAILMFILYLLFGLYYVVSGIVAKRVA